MSALYLGNDSNVAKKITSLYVGDSNNVARKIQKLYVGDSNNIARLVFGGGQGEIVGTDDIYIGYIVDGDNGATYTFYDADGNEVEPKVGQAIRSYMIEGTPTFDKYYCIYSCTTCYNSNASYTWSSNLYGSTQGTATAVGTGKANTKLVTPLNTDTSSIFYIVNQMNTSKIYGYDDWFILSKDETSNVATAVKSAVSSSVFKGKSIWSSSESSANYTWLWAYDDRRMGYGVKTDTECLLPARAF